MNKTMDEWKQEAEEKRNEERKYLLGLTDLEAQKLAVPDRYQRGRYLREQEGMQMIERFRSELPTEPIADQKPIRKKKMATVVIKDRWEN